MDLKGTHSKKKIAQNENLDKHTVTAEKPGKKRKRE